MDIGSGNAIDGSLYSSFVADNTLVDIIPSFDWDGTLPLLSCVGLAGGSVGPFKAGMTVSSISTGGGDVAGGRKRRQGHQGRPRRQEEKVPLWAALLLHQRCLCTVVPPVWLNVTNLRGVLQFERSNAALWPTTAATADVGDDRGNDDDNDGDEENDGFDKHDFVKRRDREYLPDNYYEVATRLLNARGGGGGGGGAAAGGGGGGGQSSIGWSDDSNPHALSLLIQDIHEVRMDKLRQQFLQSIEDASSSSSKLNDGDEGAAGGVQDDGLMVTLTGIGTQELAVLKNLIRQAYDDRRDLMRKKTQTAATGKENKDGGGVAGRAAAGGGGSGVPTRRRSRGRADNDGVNVADDDNDENNDALGASEESHQRRRPLRRFR